MFIAQILFIRALMCIIGQHTRRKSTGKLLGARGSVRGAPLRGGHESVLSTTFSAKCVKQ
jgi:hypothetical protein